MPPESSTAQQLTRMLIAGANNPTGESGGEAAAAQRAFEQVSAEFCRWVGTRGYEALVSRALAESREAHPALRAMQFQPRSDSYLTGFADSVDGYGDAETALALIALLEAILALLSRLIGDDIVATLVELSMKNGTRSGSDGTRNLDQRSTSRDQERA